MKVIIAGSRSINSAYLVSEAIQESGFEIDEVVSGGASGVDTQGELFARVSHTPVKRFEPDWKTHGKAAGPIRNQQMADYADALIAIWDGKSRGTKDMIGRAILKGLQIFIKVP